ncbi:hypothetical protein ACFSTC_27940 [Nonomuraea ferruginea]
MLWPAYLPLTLAVWFSGWIFGPILIGGGNEALRPEYFSMLPARPGRIAAALLAGAFAGPVPAVNLIALLSLPVYGWRFGPAGVLVGLVAAVTTLVTMVMISRVVVALIGLFVRSRATAAAVGIVTGTAIALCSNGWAPVVAMGVTDTDAWSEVFVRVLPSGWGVAAIEASWPPRHRHPGRQRGRDRPPPGRLGGPAVAARRLGRTRRCAAPPRHAPPLPGHQRRPRRRRQGAARLVARPRPYPAPRHRLLLRHRHPSPAHHHRRLGHGPLRGAHRDRDGGRVLGQPLRRRRDGPVAHPHDPRRGTR